MVYGEDFIAGTFTGIMIFLLVVLIIGVYIYSSLAWYKIAKKLKYQKPWLAWIPVASTAMRLQMGDFHWAWVFLILIPILGWIALFVLAVIATWRIYEQRKYPGWFSLAPIVPYAGGALHLIALGFVAWADRKTRVRI